MRRIVVFFALLLLLAVPVYAVSGISDATSHTQVGTNGTCQVTVTMTLTLEEAIPDLTFPLPRQARNITLNGRSARSNTSGSSRNVDLSGIVAGAGTYTVTLVYSLPDAVAENEDGQLIFTLPLLSGFALPVENFHFTVSLPGAPEYTPTFESLIDPSVSDGLTVQVQDSTVSATVARRISDSEVLTMHLQVSKEMFPQSIAKSWSMDTVDVLMIFAGLLALIYWLVTMGCRWPARERCTVPPEGITAGDVACRLTGQGVDLTLMVLSWAQMGYILIQSNDNGRVILHKRMDMGNERSEFENRYFRSLFGKRRMADATGYHYARLCRKAATTVTGRSQTYLGNTGARRIFRGLVALIGGLAGVSLAMAYVMDTVWQVVLSIPLCVLGTVAAWLMQSAAGCLHRRGKLPLAIGAVAAALWIILSLPAGEINVALFLISAQYLAGLAAFYGGRRTEVGKSTAAELMGLRKYMRTGGTVQFERLCKGNPHYYHDMAPFALALNVDKAFARQLKNVRMPQCPYLTTGMDGHMTAREFDQLLRETVSAMDALQLRLPLDRLRGR